MIVSLTCCLVLGTEMSFPAVFSRPRLLQDKLESEIGVKE